VDLQKLEVKSDSRGSLVEAFKFPNDGQLFYVVIKPGESRGNHYHNRKIERFLVIWGSATISVKDRESGNVMKATVTGDDPMVAKITPNNTHNIAATNEGCILLVWVDEIFNPKDPDTIGEEI
jgi:UDP-2-acetamido-2,6-beta-L-arabino-hexul-4-ose reductase